MVGFQVLSQRIEKGDRGSGKQYTYRIPDPAAGLLIMYVKVSFEHYRSAAIAVYMQ